MAKAVVATTEVPVPTEAPKVPGRQPELPAPEAMQWFVTTIERTHAKQPALDWAVQIVQASWDNKTALGIKLESEKQARAALHQVQRAAAQLGLGLSVQQDGAELRIQAKLKKVVTPKPA